MEIGPLELIQYCQTVAGEFEERLDRLRMLVDYKLRSGTALAEILRSFLAENSSGKYNVAEGFVVNPFVKEAASNHCDVLVYDCIQYPLLDAEGEVKVVLPRAASMIIEVERELSSERLGRGFENVRSARSIYPYMSGILFGFDGLEPEALFEAMGEHAATCDAALAPIAVINMAQGVVAHRSLLATELGGARTPFDVYRLGKDAPRSAFVFLLLLYFDLQMHGMLTAGCLAQAGSALLETAHARHLGQIDLE